MELGHRPRILCRGYLGPECVYVYVAMMAVKLDERRVVFMYILTLRETFPLVEHQTTDRPTPRAGNAHCDAPRRSQLAWDVGTSVGGGAISIQMSIIIDVT